MSMRQSIGKLKMYGYKDNIDSKLALHGYHKTDIIISRPSYDNLIDEAVKLGILPKTYKSVCKSELQFPCMPREGVGRDLFLDYEKKIDAIDISTRMKFDFYKITSLVNGKKLSGKSSEALKEFLKDKFNDEEYFQGEETLTYISAYFQDRSLFDFPCSDGGVNSIKRNEYEGIRDSIVAGANLINSKLNESALGFIIDKLKNLQRPNFKMGAHLFDEYIKGGPMPSREIRVQLDSAVIDSLIDRVGDFPSEFSRAELEYFKNDIISRVKMSIVVDGKLVDEGQVKIAQRARLNEERQKKEIEDNEKRNRYGAYIGYGVIALIPFLLYAFVWSLSSMLPAPSGGGGGSGTDCRTFQERALRDAMRSEGLSAPCD